MNHSSKKTTTDSISTIFNVNWRTRRRITKRRIAKKDQTKTTHRLKTRERATQTLRSPTQHTEIGSFPVLRILYRQTPRFHLSLQTQLHLDAIISPENASTAVVLHGNFLRRGRRSQCREQSSTQQPSHNTKLYREETDESVFQSKRTLQNTFETVE